MMTAEDESGGRKVESPSDPIQECTRGLLEQFVPQADKVREKLTSLTEKQLDLSDKVAAQGEKFDKTEQEYDLDQMLKKTRAYHGKLIDLRREMGELSQRSGQMKVRALRLQEAKQKEALKRENMRQKELEREEMLVARQISD